MIEVWKPVVGFEGLYEVSNLGAVRSLARLKRGKHAYSHYPVAGRVLRGKVLREGYIQYSLSKGGLPHYRNGHRLVAHAFLAPVPGKTFVNHRDGVKTNNCVTNLEYCTMAENNKHAGDMNLKPIGTAHTNSKFTPAQLREIRALLSEDKLSHRAIASKFGVVRSTISNIKRGTTYSKEQS